MAERVGFEPTVGCPTHAFQACAFDRSAISPESLSDSASGLVPAGLLGLGKGGSAPGRLGIRRPGTRGGPLGGPPRVGPGSGKRRREPTAPRGAAIPASAIRRVFARGGRGAGRDRPHRRPPVPPPRRKPSSSRMLFLVESVTPCHRLPIRPTAPGGFECPPVADPGSRSFFIYSLRPPAFPRCSLGFPAAPLPEPRRLSPGAPR